MLYPDSLERLRQRRQGCAFAALESQANQAATGHNHHPDPTPAQIAAGNYRLGRVTLAGLPIIRIENVRNSVRAGQDAAGKAWSCRMAAHYGYFAGTKGADGDGVDVFVGPFPESRQAWVINQRNKDGSFDEHKCMVGFHTEEQARNAYQLSYSPGWTGLKSIVPAAVSQLAWWLKHGDMSRELTEDQLPFEGQPIMDKVLWSSDAMPVSIALPQLMYGLRKIDGDAGLLLDHLTMDELMADPDLEAGPILDALVTEVGYLKRKMDQLLRVLKAAGGEVTATDYKIADPVKLRGALQVAVLFSLSDGQTMTIWFHNPDSTPARLTPMDELISWKWMLNKLDVTIAVAPERGRDLNVRVVASRVMRLAEKNSEAFVKANAKAAEWVAQGQALDDEISALEGELASVQRQIEVAKIAKEDGEIAKVKRKRGDGIDPTTAQGYAEVMADEGLQRVFEDALDPLFSDRILAVRNALRALGWEIPTSTLLGHKTIDGGTHSIRHEPIKAPSGANIMGVVWSVDDGTTTFKDNLVLPVDDLARAIDSSIMPIVVQAEEPALVPAVDEPASVPEVVDVQATVPEEDAPALPAADLPPEDSAPEPGPIDLGDVPGTILTTLDGTEVLSMMRVQDDDGNTIPADKQVFDAAREYFRQTIQGRTFKNVNVGDVMVNGRVTWGKVKQALTYNLLRVKLLAAIPELLRRGAHVGSTGLDKERTDGAQGFHHLVGWVKVADVSVEVGISVVQMERGQYMYNLADSPSKLLAKKQSRIVKSGEGPTDPALDSATSAAGDDANLAPEDGDVNPAGDVLDDASGLVLTGIGLNFYILKVRGADGQDMPEEVPANEPVEATLSPVESLSTVARVDAAYNFLHATERFKAYIGDTVGEADASMFQTARAVDQAVYARGAAVSWDLEYSEYLDSTEHAEKAVPEQDQGAAPVLDGATVHIHVVGRVTDGDAPVGSVYVDGVGQARAYRAGVKSLSLTAASPAELIDQLFTPLTIAAPEEMSEPMPATPAIPQEEVPLTTEPIVEPVAPAALPADIAAEPVPVVEVPGEPIVAAEPLPSPANDPIAVPAAAADDGRLADVQYLQALIAGEVDMLDAGIFDRLEPMFAMYEQDDEMMALLNSAATAFSDATTKAAQAALA